MKSYITKTLFLSLTILFIVPTSASAAPLQANGFNTSVCNTQVSSSASITEDRSFYISDGWMGGFADADDQIGYSARVNGATVVVRSYPWSVGCGDTGASSGWDGINTFLGGNTDNDTILFSLTAYQKRDEEVNYFWGRIYYDYTRDNCAGGQMTLNNFCQWINGNITAVAEGQTALSGQTITCIAPCSPTINWTTNLGNGSRVEKNGSTWQTSPTGSSVDSNLSSGTYTYALYIRDGYNNEYGCCAVAVQVNAAPVEEPVQCELIFSPDGDITVGETLSWTVNSIPPGYAAYWYGTKNGVTDANGLYAGDTNFTQSFTYQSAHVGTYTRYLVLRDVGGTPVCTTNSKTFTVSEAPAPAPSVDIKANGSDGPITIDFNSAATLSWSSSDTTSCSASGGWSGSKGLSGSQSTGALTSSVSFSILCSGEGGDSEDIVTVNVSEAPTYTLTTFTSGSGSITGPGISCPGDCSETYTEAQTISLTASPSSGSQFDGWSPGSGFVCSGQGTTCSFFINTNLSAQALFSAIPTPFNYNLSNSGTVNVTKSSTTVFSTNTVTKTLTAGTSQSVNLSVTGLPSGVSVQGISNQGCSPTCTSVITLAIAPTAQTGTHTVTVSGSSLGKQTQFSLRITGNPMSVSCTHNPASALVGQSVAWTASVSGGTAPFTYSWSGTNIPSNPAPSTNPFNIVYSTLGQKTAQVIVTDNDDTQSTCPTGSIQINFNPD